MHEQFELSYNIPRIVLVIQLETEEVVPEGGALIVLDEIQTCPKPPRILAASLSSRLPRRR